MAKVTLRIEVEPGEHGGASMYEFVPGADPSTPPNLAFGGNLDEMTAYFRTRLAEIIVQPAIDHRDRSEQPRRVLGPPPPAADTPRAPQTTGDYHRAPEEFKDRPRALNPKILRDDAVAALDDDLRG